MYISDPTLSCSLLLFNAKVKLIEFSEEAVLVHVTIFSIKSFPKIY